MDEYDEEDEEPADEDEYDEEEEPADEDEYEEDEEYEEEPEERPRRRAS